MAQDLNVPKAEAGKHVDAVRYDREFVRLVFRDIASDTNERTLIFGLLPKNCGGGNTIHISIPKYYVRGVDGGVTTQVVSPLRLLFALAWFEQSASRLDGALHDSDSRQQNLPLPSAHATTN